MLEDMQVRNLAPHTSGRIAANLAVRPTSAIAGPARPDDIRAIQLHLTQDKRLSASSILVAVAAIRSSTRLPLKRDWNIDD